jgi:hypothetical protein
MDFHLEQTPYSDPGDLDVSGLPHDPGGLAALVRNLIVHRGEGGRLGHGIPEDRRHDDPEARYVRAMLRILWERDPAPLTEARADADRFVGTCRDFSLLLCGLLRATGTPARVRCGFARYFVEGWHEDHWVTEYRLPDGSWRLIDAQVLHPSYALPFDPLDVPRDRFLVAGDAWRACREGAADPRAFGVWGHDDLAGLWYVGSRIPLDLAALARVELLPWDFWGPAVRSAAELTADRLALLDAAAALTEEEASRVTVPGEVLSYTSCGGHPEPRTVTLAR